MTTDKVAVSQEARDLFKTIYRYDDPDGERYVDEGRFDALPLMQRLARFEAQARLAGKREGMEEAAKVVEAEIELVRKMMGQAVASNHQDTAYACAGTALRIAAAIREQNP